MDRLALNFQRCCFYGSIVCWYAWIVLYQFPVSELSAILNHGNGCPIFLSLLFRYRILLITERQHYRLYVIHQIPSLKVLDFVKISASERDRSQRLANSAAGAALESDVQIEAKAAAAASSTKTFVPGEGESAEEAFVTNFTPEQKETIRLMVANAKSPAEIDEIERSVRLGIFPSLPPPAAAATVPPLVVDNNAPATTTNVDDDGNRKRAAEEPAENGTDAKRGRLKEG